MATNIITAESAFSRGQTQFSRWEAQFEERWNRPVLVGQIATLLASIPPEVRQHLPQNAIKALEDKIMQVGDSSYASKISGESIRPASQTFNGQIPGQLPINPASLTAEQP